MKTETRPDNDQQLAARSTTFDGIVPHKVWISFRNTVRKDYFTVILEVNGIEEIIEEFYIPGLDRNEGLVCMSQNLTWLLEGKDCR